MTENEAVPGPSRASRFKRRLADGETVFGAWLTTPDLSVAEILAGAGFDFVIVDAEHSPWTNSELQLALAGFSASPTVVLVRIPSLDAVAVKQVLDVGVDGIVCPMVRDAAEAATLVSAARYPPAGTRGFGPRRASAYGRSVDAYTASANADVIIIPQIEDVAAVAEVDAILDVDGVDALSLGPTDLSGTLGLLRQFDHPRVLDAVDAVLAKAKARGVAVCTGIVVEPDVVDGWIAKGARMPLITSDVALLVDGAAAVLARVRETR